MTRTLLRACLDCGRQVRGKPRCRDCQAKVDHAKHAKRPDMRVDLRASALELTAHQQCRNSYRRGFSRRSLRRVLRAHSHEAVPQGTGLTLRVCARSRRR